MKFADLSVCTPLYLSKDVPIALIRKMLNSVATQDLLPREMIFTDDKPSDFSYGLIKDFSESVNFEVHYLPNSNRLGLAANANHALSLGKSELLHCLQQDDHLLEKSVYRTLFTKFLPSESKWAFLTGNYGTRTMVPFFTDVTLLGFNYMGGLSGLIQRNGYLELLNNSLTQLSDVDLYERLFRKYGNFFSPEGVNISFGFGTHQTGQKISDKEMVLEFQKVISDHQISLSRIFVALDQPGFFGLRRNLSAALLLSRT